MRKFDEYKRRIREGRTVARLVGETGDEAHSVLAQGESNGVVSVPIPQTRIIRDESGGVGPATGGVPRTMFYSPSEIATLREAGIAPGLLQRSVLDIGTILGFQNEHNLRLGDTVEVDRENWGEPPEEWILRARLLEPNIALPENTIHPEFSLSHPKAWHDGMGNWYYNFPGAVLLSDVLGRRLPTVNQLDLAIRQNPEIFRQAKGYYNPGTVFIRGSEKSYVHDLGGFSHFWTATHDRASGNDATSLVLKIGEQEPVRMLIHRRLFLPVRLVIEMPDEYYLAKMVPAPTEES